MKVSIEELLGLYAEAVAMSGRESASAKIVLAMILIEVDRLRELAGETGKEAT